ncbi:MAG: nucleotide exchange factor GrpE [Candidatus Hydrogenedentales bacterium]
MNTFNLKYPHMEKTTLERQLEKELEQEAMHQPRDSEAEEGARENEENSAPDAAVSDEASPEFELAQVRDQLLRTRADFENYRKRMARETERIRKTAAESLVADLLPVLDHLELALAHAGDESGGVTEGVELVAKQLRTTLERHGVSQIPDIGELFNPQYHEAVTVLDSDAVPENHVVQVFQRGFKLGDQVLRPSRVAVSKGPAQRPQEDEDGEE